MTDTEDRLPEVFEAVWDHDQVATLFEDLQQSAEVKRVQVRTASDGQRPQDSIVTLQRARELLAEDVTKAIQIYYEYDGRSWCDTLMFLTDNIRIVRTTLPADR